MNEKEKIVKLCEVDVKIAETRVRETKSALDNGYQKLKADMDREYDKLKAEHDRAVLELEREKAHLAHARAELERGYSVN